MSIKRGLQLRVEAPEGELKEFMLFGHNYEIIGVSESRHLIPSTPPAGSLFSGSVKQFTVKEKETDRTCEVYVYFYNAYFENKTYAVIDAIDTKD